METNTMQVFQLLIGSGGILGILVLIFRTGKLVEKVEAIDLKMSKMNSNFEDDFREIKSNITTLAIQVSKLETRVEERTLKVIHVEKSG